MMTENLSRRDFLKLSSALGASAAVFVISGCASSGSSDGGEVTESESISAVAETEMRTITDASGSEVTIPADPQRIAVAPGPGFAMVYAMLGSIDKVVAMHEVAWTGYQNSIMKDVAPGAESIDHSIFGGETINVESLVSLNPDLAILWTSQSDIAAQLMEVGIPAVQLKAASTMEELETLIAQMGDALNIPERTQAFLDWYAQAEAEVDAHASDVQAISEEERPKVLHFYTVEDLNIYQNESSNLDLTTKAGGRNYVGAEEEEAVVTMESILEYDPDVIFISNFDEVTPNDFYENVLSGQDWSGVSAIKKKRVYKVPMALYRWAPPNCIEKPMYYHWIAQHMLPEVYADFDIDEELRYFFATFLNYDLNQDQVDEMLRKDMNGEI